MLSLYALMAQVDIRPDPGGLPGTEQLQQLVNGLAFWALLACLGVVLAGAAMWAGGSRASHFGAVASGKSMVFGGAIGGLLVGASAAIVNFFHSVGSGVSP